MVSSNISSTFPKSSIASILIVYASPAQFGSGINSIGNPFNSPTARTVVVSPTTSHPDGKLLTLIVIVVGAFPSFNSVAWGKPPCSEITHGPCPDNSNS